MINFVIQGFLLGVAYVAPIGMQNTYVINTATQSTKKRALQVGLITALFDIALALACFFGVGLILEQSEILKMGVMGLGSIAVLYIGISLIRSTPEGVADTDVNKPIGEIIMMIFVVTWLNPQALIDGSLLLGGFKSSLSTQASTFFIMGVMLASTTWFLSLSTLANKFRSRLTVQVLKVVNVVCGLTIVGFGLKLGWAFLSGYVI